MYICIRGIGITSQILNEAEQNVYYTNILKEFKRQILDEALQDSYTNILQNSKNNVGV